MLAYLISTGISTPVVGFLEPLSDVFPSDGVNEPTVLVTVVPEISHDFSEKNGHTFYLHVNDLTVYNDKIVSIKNDVTSVTIKPLK